MALKPFNVAGGLSVGVVANAVVDSGANIEAAKITANGNVSFTGANVSLGNVANLHIIGGSNGQVLSTDGSGSLSWVTNGDPTSISNGNSSVSIPVADGEIEITSNGAISLSIGETLVAVSDDFEVGGLTTTSNLDVNENANVIGNLTVNDTTQLNILNVTSTSNLGNVGNVTIIGGSNGQVLTTNGSGNLSWTTLDAVANANYAAYAGEAYSVSGANVSGEVANANYASFSGEAYSVSGANVSGEVANANYAVYSGEAYSVSGANVSGTVANANYALYANISATANTVAWANVTGAVSPSSEFHVAANGNDTTGNGTILNPYLTISKAVTVVGSGGKILIHPGSYNEDVAVANKFAVTFSAADSGGSSASTPSISGNVTVSGNSSSIAFKGIAVRSSVTHSATGSLYITNMRLGSGNIVGTVTKSGSGYLSVQDSAFDSTSGGNLSQVSITGNGISLLSNVAIASLTVNNSATQVTVTGGSTTLNATLTAGTLNVFESFMYTLGNSGFFALSSTSGTVNLRNATLINPDLTPARINLSGSTVFAYGDLYFDKANSNLGIQAGVTLDFQALRVSNGVTSSTLSVSGNANVGNIGATNFVGSGASLTSITGANVTGTVANANYATTAGTANSVAVANVVGIGNIATVNLTGNTGQVLIGNGGWAELNNTANANYANFAGTAYGVDGGNVTGTVANATYAANAGFADSAGYVTQGTQSNITSVGTLTGLTSNGTVNFTGASNVSLGAVGNVKITGGSNGQLLSTDGSGNISWTAAPTGVGIANGTSNVNIPTANGSIRFGANGVANLMIISGNAAPTVYMPARPEILPFQNVLQVDGQVTLGSNVDTHNVYITRLEVANVSKHRNGIIVESAVAQIQAGVLSNTLTGYNNANVIISANNFIDANANVSVILKPVGPSGVVDVWNKKISNVATPTNNSDAATKAYVDSIAQGLHVHAPAIAATPDTLANITSGTITYNNGTDGVGATLTTTGTYTTIDGVNIATIGARILVKNEANAAHNGIYTYTTSTVLTRATDFDTSTEMGGGDFTFVQQGTLYNDTGWVMADPVTAVGTSPVNFVQFSGAGTYTAGTGLTLNGTQFSITNTTVTAASYGGGDSVATFTVNEQGQLTSASNTAITANAANLTGTSLASTIITSSLTSVGTLGNLSVTGDANVGNIGATGGVFTGNISALNADLGNLVVANFFQGDGGLLTNVAATGSLSSGNSNITIAANGNISMSVTGTANVIVVSSNAANVTGSLGVSGNVTGANIVTDGVVSTANTIVGGATITTTSTAASQVIAKVAASNGKVVEFLVKGVDGTAKYGAATLLSQVGTASNGECDYSTYGVLSTGSSPGELSVALVDGNANVALLVQPTSSNSTVWITQYRVL